MFKCVKCEMQLIGRHHKCGQIEQPVYIEVMVGGNGWGRFLGSGIDNSCNY